LSSCCSLQLGVSWWLVHAELEASDQWTCLCEATASDCLWNAKAKYLNVSNNNRACGALPSPVVTASEKFPKEITQAFQEQRTALSQHEQRLSDCTRILYTMIPALCMFQYLDILKKCAVVHRVKLLNSVQQTHNESQPQSITGRV